MIAVVDPAASGTAVDGGLGDWPGQPLHARSLPCDADEGPPDAVGRLPTELKNAVRKRRTEYRAGRRCAAQALGDAGYTGPGWIGMGADRLPCWPDGWTGSISHSDRRAIAVVARRSACRSIGVDIERIGRCGDTPPTGSVGTAAEWSLIDRPLPFAFTLLFSAKEALYKALYPLCRRFQDFGAARLTAVTGTSLRLCLSHRWGEGLPAGRAFDVSTLSHDGHVHACVRIDATTPAAVRPYR